MDHSHPAAQRQATLAVLGILSIPLVSVLSAALIADASSAASHSSIGPGLLATTIGAVAGLSLQHLIRGVVSGVVSIRAVAIESRPPVLPWWVSGPSSLLKPSPMLVPCGPLRLSPVRRRGPPALV